MLSGVAAIPKISHLLPKVTRLAALAGMPDARSPQTQSIKLFPKTAALDGFLEHGQLQLILVCADGIQVGPIKCRFIRSYLWFEGACCSYSRSKKPLNAGRTVGARLDAQHESPSPATGTSCDNRP